ncbi:NrsF family protein [Rhizobium sp.]
MRTEDLISALAADAKLGTGLGRSLLAALAVGTLLTGIVFFATLGFRQDIGSAMQTMRFGFKFAVTLSLAAAAGAIVLRIGRPGMPVLFAAWTLAIPVLLLATGVMMEMRMIPDDTWSVRLIGRSWTHCLLAIPAFSIPTLAALLYALRAGAPSSPALAGAMAGLASAAIAATYYASNCRDDSPLFVATWYTIAIGIVALAGALIGRRVLRW